MKYFINFLLVVAINSNAQIFKEITVQSIYGEPTIISSIDINKIMNVVEIEYHYSQFARDSSFNQSKLDSGRWQNLEKLLGSTFDPQLVKKTDAGKYYSNYSTASKSFHGFKITYREKPGPESLKNEIEYIDSIVSSLTDTIPTVISIEQPVDPEIYDVKRSERKRRKREGDSEPREMLVPITEYTIGDCPCNFSAHINKLYTEVDLVNLIRDIQDTCGYLSYSTTSTDSRDSQFLINISCTTATTSSGVGSLIIPSMYRGLSDAAIIDTVFKRNKNWKDMLLAVDVTGSMSPYTGQVVTWLKLKTNASRVSQLTFFNDGDNKFNKQKITGSVGGIYNVRTESFEQMLKVMRTAMINGGGGDCPENNLEAIRDGLSVCNDCSDIVLVADNWATPRDLKLLKSINKPIHIILCGAWYGINIDYLNLALQSGGSIHTIEEDLNDLMKMSEGETINFMGTQYQIKNGEFVVVKGV